MPVAKIHVNEGVYAPSRIQKISNAVQSALLEVLKIPPDDFFQIIHELPKPRFLHTPSFLGLTYSDEFILLEMTFLAGRSRETRLALLKELNQRVAAQAGISKDDLVIMLYEIPGENASFGRVWRSAHPSLPPPSAVNLVFLSLLAASSFRNFKFKTALES